MGQTDQPQSLPISIIMKKHQYNQNSRSFKSLILSPISFLSKHQLQNQNALGRAFFHTYSISNSKVLQTTVILYVCLISFKLCCLSKYDY